MSLRTLLKYTAAGRWLMIVPRFLLLCVPRLGGELVRMLRWAVGSKEYYNHTYHLTNLNRDYLVSYVAVVSGHDEATIEGYFRELETDEEFRSQLVRLTQQSRDRHNCDVEPRYGRRIGWYALVRATRPRVVMETGVDRGLGTAVIAAALRRNAAEGQPGIVHATDILADCGHLLAEPYKSHCRILLGDSVETLKKFGEPVDVFLHDSDHRPAYEWAEFLAIAPCLHAASLVLSDNSQQSPKLREFAARTGRKFLYFQDQPRDHWWPGDGIGAAFPAAGKVFYPGLAFDAKPPGPS